jgi:hypothetical protein
LLFFPAVFHADVVIDLACRAGVIRHAAALLIPALLAGVRLFGARAGADPGNTGRDKQQDDGYAHRQSLRLI